ncbi:MAG TPA: sulfatase-like hydrolase/transferase [Pirellulaceae bacterium]|nr:sulfatase-like hydrolase/transferase [Pirellulaceae bacterium]
MNRLLLAMIGLLGFCLHATPLSAQTRKPNVIVILADDLGYSDLGVQGGKDIPTPNIDSIAKSGVRCTQSYVSCPYCSPTRAGLNTGRYQTRFGHEFNEPAADQRENFGLPLSEKTIADRMKALGYATGAIGKWHLGYSASRRPMARGYDEFFGTLGNTPFFHPTNFVDSRKSAEVQPITDDSFYTTDAYGERAEQFITAHKDHPFLLYLPFNAQHVPSQAPQKYLDRFPNIADEGRKLYAGMLASFDDAVGRVLKNLRDHGLEDNTLIFFMSDNGGPITKMGGNGSINRPLKGQKGDTWEGGIHVPLFVQWKSRLPAGKVYDQPVISLDILPTSVAAAGTEIGTDWQLDGVNLLPHLLGRSTAAPHDALYWRFGPQWAIRQGNWKLVSGFDYVANNTPDPLAPPVANPPPAPPQPHLVKVTAPQLYNLADDPGETKDLASAQPDRVAALKAAWDKWNHQNKDPAWVPNPNPAKAKAK